RHGARRYVARERRKGASDGNGPPGRRDVAGQLDGRQRHDHEDDERRDRRADGELAGALRGWGERRDEPRGADRLGARSLLRDGALARALAGRQHARRAPHLVDGHVPAGRRHHEDRADGRRKRPRHGRRGLRAGRADREGELSRLEGARRRPRDDAGGEANLTVAMATDFEQLVTDLERSYTEVQERMSDPSVYNDRREAAEVGRKLKELEAPYKLAQEWRAVHDDLSAARDDADLKELVPELEAREDALQEELRLAMVQSDPADAKDVILEIRQGTGGDEAAHWAGDLYRMLARYAERRGFKVEELGASANDGGGYKEVTFAVKGDGAYSVFKWEGG